MLILLDEVLLYLLQVQTWHLLRDQFIHRNEVVPHNLRNHSLRLSSEALEYARLPRDLLLLLQNLRHSLLKSIYQAPAPPSSLLTVALQQQQVLVLVEILGQSAVLTLNVIEIVVVVGFLVRALRRVINLFRVRQVLGDDRGLSVEVGGLPHRGGHAIIDAGLAHFNPGW